MLSQSVSAGQISYASSRNWANRLLSVVSHVTAVLVVLSLLTAVSVFLGQRPASASSPYSFGDVFVSTASGTVLHYNLSGQLQGTLSTNASSNETGMCFDATSNLYVTNFGAETMSKFDNMGNLASYPYQSFSSTYPDSNSESCTFNSAGELFVGVPRAPCPPNGCPGGVLEEFSPTGSLLHTWSPTVENAGIDWIDLAPDQCTLYYTSEGPDILRFNVCTGQQESNFASGAPGQMWAMRIRPGGDVLATDSVDGVVRFNTAGQIAQTYPLSSFKNPDGTSAAILFALTLDPDGSSFWAAATTYSGEATVTYPGEIYKMGIASGSLEQTINTGQPQSAFGTTGGLVTYGGASPLGGAIGADGRANGSADEACAVCQTGATAQPSRADPVNTATGDFYEPVTDVSVPGPGLPLAFTRTYDAAAAQAGTSGPMGTGWFYNLGISLAYNSHTHQATITEENGSQVVFNAYSASTGWCSSAFNFCPSSPRVIATLNQNSDRTWTFVRDLKAGQTLTFSSSGVLTKVADAAGNSLVSSSGSAGTGFCPSGKYSCTVWTSSASGRTLTLQFNTSKPAQLVSVIGYAASGGSPPSASFCEYGQTCAPGSGGLSGDLYSVTDPGSLTTSYAYDTSNLNTSFRHDILTRTGPLSGAVVTNTYDSSGRVTQQQDASGQVTTLSYSGTPTTGVGGTTTVTTYPQGLGTGKPSVQVVYQYSWGELIGETTGSGSSTSTELFTRDPVSGLARTTVDGDGNPAGNAFDDSFQTSGSEVTDANTLTSTDALGYTTQNAYTPVSSATGAPPPNLKYCTVDAADYANGVRCPGSPPTTPPAAGSGRSSSYLGAAITYYDSAGNPTAVTDARGYTSITAYTASGLGVPVELAYCTVDGNEYSLAGVTCPSYNTTKTGATTSTYDAAGNLKSTTSPTGGTTSYSYTNPSYPNLATTVTDPDNTVTTNTYDSTGRLTKQVVSFGSYSATSITAYDSAGRSYCTIAALAYSEGDTTCPAAPSAPPAAGTDPWPGTTITIYDADNRPTYRVNPLGGVTQTAYDEAGEAFCTVSALAYSQGTTCPTSPPTSPPTPTSDPYLGATVDTYDAQGRLVQETNSLGGVTLHSYDGAGNDTQKVVESNNATSAPNITTDYSYDADNRLVSTTVDPGGSPSATTLQSYEPDGNVYCSVSTNAVAAGSGAYQCPLWQAAWIAAPPSPSSLYPGSANNVTTNFYDPNGSLVQTTNPSVDTTVTAYDADGRSYCTSDPTNVAAWLSAHPSGTYPYLCPNQPPTSPPAQGSNPGYTTTIYDASGRVSSSTDQLGDTTSYQYDPAGHQSKVTDPRGEVTSYCYYFQNASGQCAASAPAGGGSGDDRYAQTTPATSADPSGETTTYTYYPGDSAAATTTPSGTATDSYDANADLTGVTYSNTASGYATPANLTYGYYQDGTRKTMTDGTGTTSYGEDDMGDRTSQQFSPASGSGLTSNIVSYTYFSTGALSSVIYPSYGSYTNPSATYTYDALGNMATETDWQGNKVSFSHDGDGNLTAQDNVVSSTNPSGTSSTSFSYDGADQNSQATSTLTQTCGGTETLTQAFSGSGGSRNPDGQVTQDSESYANSCSGQGSYQRNYSYDLAGRVVYQGSSVQGSNPNNIAYDPSGDPTTISSHDSQGNFDTYAQTFDSAGEVQNQQPVSGSQGINTTYSYDSLGDRRMAGTTTYGYDQASHLTAVSSTVKSTLSIGGYSVMALKPDGTVWDWGYNYYGNLGNGTTTTTGCLCIPTPVQVSNLSGSIGVAEGADQTVALKSDGTVWDWGYNAFGQLGNGTVANSSVPVQVSGLSAATAIASGGDFSMALKSDGTVWAWGYNASGQLGDGNTINSSVPVQVSGLTGVTAIATGVYSAYALKSDGTVWAWGYNQDGELGNGGSGGKSTTPVQVSGLTGVTAVTAVATGSNNEHGMALKSDGTVWAWGNGLSGQLGNGTTTSSTIPVEVSGLSGVTAIAAGDAHSLALKSDGTVWAWGYNYEGELGDGTTNTAGCGCVTTPVQVSGLTSAVAISAGLQDSAALKSDGTVWEWGDNLYGEAGNGTVSTTGCSCNDVPVESNMNNVLQPQASASYRYNGEGLAGGKTASGITNTYIWDSATANGPAMLLSDSTNDYVYGPTGGPVEQVNVTSTPPANNPLFMTYTPSNSSWLLTNAAGNEVSFYRYDAFGNLSFGTPGSPFGYAGQYQDALSSGTGFYDMRARWYDAQSGQFTSWDPAFRETNHAYSYAGDDPVNRSDPTGQLTRGQLSSLTQVAYNIQRLPDGLDGLSRGQLAAILWSITPTKCPRCTQGLGWSGDFPYMEAAGAMGSLSQWSCLTLGLVPGGCYPPNPNPSWASWKAAAVFGLSLTAVATGGLAIGAEEPAFTALTITSAAATLGSAAWNIKPCSQGNVGACLGIGLDVISVGVGLGGALGIPGFTGDLIAAGGEAVAVSGGFADVFSVVVAQPFAGSHGTVCLSRTATKPVPAPGIVPSGTG